MPGCAMRTTPAGLYLALRQDILCGRLAPGARLGVRELAGRYGAGQIPLREALNRLHAERLVLHEQRRGFFVGAASVEDVIDLTATRLWLYEGALRKSIEIGDEAWEEGIVLAFFRLQKACADVSPAHGSPGGSPIDPHRAFHTALIAGCRSRRTLELSERLFDEAERYRHLSRLATPRPGVQEEHRRIMDAALAGRADEAVHALREHLNRTCEAVVKYLGAGQDRSEALQNESRLSNRTDTRRRRR